MLTELKKAIGKAKYLKGQLLINMLELCRWQTELELENYVVVKIRENDWKEPQ